ncbi:MAG: ABC transporter permease subunit [Saprospiraceae bacterium]|mgnify:FL=1
MMRTLLKLEWLKFRKNSVVIALSAIFVALFPLIILTGKKVFANVPPPMPGSITFYEFPTVWDYQGYVGNWFVSFCLGFMMVYMITSEVSNRTQRQSIINGLTRKEYWMSKISVLLSLSFVATLMYVVSSILLGLIHTDGYDFEIIWDNNFAIPRFFMMCLGYLSFAFFVAVWIRKGTLAILVYFSYIMFIEPVIRAIHLYYFNNRSTLFYPMNVVEDLMPNPFFKLPDVWLEKEWGFKILLSHTEALGFSALYIALFISLSWWIFMKKDI